MDGKATRHGLCFNICTQGLEAKDTGVKELGSLGAFSLISSKLPLISLIVLYNACDPSSAMSVTVGHHFVLEWKLRFPPKKIPQMQLSRMVNRIPN